MSAQLPYLPPLNRSFTQDVAGIAADTANEVRQAQGAARKAGTTVRGAAAVLPAIAKAADTPGAAMREQVGAFLSSLFGGAQVPATAVAPATVAPVVSAAPVLSLPSLAAPVPPAPTGTTTGGVTATRQGNNVMITGDSPAPGPERAPTGGLPVYRRDTVGSGATLQAQYAAAQRDAVLNAADIAAASGHPDNASYRYAAALHALPSLSGSNNFAATQAQLAASSAATAEQERANIRTTGEQRYATEARSEEVRRNAQPTVIGEEINPDPTTRVFAPTIKRYGFVSLSKDGKVEVRDMQGTVQKPPEAPKVVVGAKVKQKDGQYPLDGGRTAVVKGGVITELK